MLIDDSTLTVMMAQVSLLPNLYFPVNQQHPGFVLKRISTSKQGDLRDKPRRGKRHVGRSHPDITLTNDPNQTRKRRTSNSISSFVTIIIIMFQTSACYLLWRLDFCTKKMSNISALADNDLRIDSQFTQGDSKLSHFCDTITNIHYECIFGYPNLGLQSSSGSLPSAPRAHLRQYSDTAFSIAVPCLWNDLPQ